MGPDVELGKEFKAAVMNVFKEAKETMSKIKEKCDDDDSISGESKQKNTSHKRPREQFWSWKYGKREKKNALDGLRIRYEMAGERIGELKDRSIAMIKFEESKNINRK